MQERGKENREIDREREREKDKGGRPPIAIAHGLTCAKHMFYHSFSASGARADVPSALAGFARQSHPL